MKDKYEQNLEIISSFHRKAFLIESNLLKATLVPKTLPPEYWQNEFICGFDVEITEFCDYETESEAFGANLQSYLINLEIAAASESVFISAAPTWKASHRDKTVYSCSFAPVPCQFLRKSNINIFIDLCVIIFDNVYSRTMSKAEFCVLDFAISVPRQYDIGRHALEYTVVVAVNPDTIISGLSNLLLFVNSDIYLSGDVSETQPTPFFLQCIIPFPPSISSSVLLQFYKTSSVSNFEINTSFCGDMAEAANLVISRLRHRLSSA